MKSPVLGFDNAGTAELILEGENGFLFRTSEELKNLIIRFSKDRELLDKIGYKASLSASKYSVENYGNSIFKILDRD